MPEEDQENSDQQVEEEMMRMMQQELGDEAETETGQEADSSEADAEDELFLAMQQEMAQAQPEGGEEADDSALEAEMLRTMMEETGTSEGEAQEALQRMRGGLVPERAVSSSNIARLLDVSLSVAIELGSKEFPISSILEWTEGSLLELDKVSGDAVDVLVNGKPFAKGEVITIAENFGVRITEVTETASRR